MTFTASYTIKANDQFSSVARKFERVFSEIEKKVNRVNAAMAGLRKLQSSLTKSFDSETKSIRAFNAELSKTSSHMSSMNKKKFGMSGGPSGGGSGSSGRMFGGLGRNLRTAAIGYIGYQGVSSVIQNTGELQDSFADLSAQTGVSGKDLETLETKVFSLGRTYRLANNEIAQGFTVAGSIRPDLMGDIDLLQKFGEQAVKLSVAGKLTMTESSEAIGIALNAMGAASSQSEKFTEIISAGAKYGAANIQNISLALENVGGVAKEAGLQFEDVITMIELAGFTKLGATGGEHVKGIITSLATKGMDFKKLGAIGGLEKFGAAISKGKNESQRLAIAVKLVGKDFASTALAMVANLDKGKIIRAHLNETGATNEMVAKQMSTMNAQWQVLKNNLSLLSDVMMTRLSPAISAVLSTMATSIGNDALNLIQKNKVRGTLGAVGTPKSKEDVERLSYFLGQVTAGSMTQGQATKSYLSGGNKASDEFYKNQEVVVKLDVNDPNNILNIKQTSYVAKPTGNTGKNMVSR